MTETLNSMYNNTYNDTSTFKIIDKQWNTYTVIQNNKIQEREGKRIVLNGFNYNFLICKCKGSKGYCVYHYESGLLIPPDLLDLTTITACINDAIQQLNKIGKDNYTKYLDHALNNTHRLNN